MCIYLHVHVLNVWDYNKSATYIYLEILVVELQEENLKRNSGYPHYHQDYCLCAINLKLNVTSDDCPNLSLTDTTSVCLSVPNLPIPTFSGKEHFLAGSPSNEHIADTGLLVDLQKNV